MCAFSFGVNGALVDRRNTTHLKVLAAKCWDQLNTGAGPNTPEKPGNW